MHLSMGILADNVPINPNGKHIDVITSLGISINPDDRLKDKLLMKKADAAMYKAKEMVLQPSGAFGGFFIGRCEDARPPVNYRN
jgi:GGDEF domain-containing protein